MVDHRRLLSHIPNALTLLRGVSGPIVAALVLAHAYGPALTLFVIAALTDFIDGYLARKLSAETKLGASLDPLADKALVLFALLALWDSGSLDLVSQGASFIIFLREAVVLALRLYARNGQTIASSSTAKLKTVLQMIGVAAVLASAVWPHLFLDIAASVMLVAAAVLGLMSAAGYVRHVTSSPRAP